MVEARCKKLGVTPKEYRVSRRDIREWTRWSDFQIKCHIRQLEDMEYLYSITGKKGKEYVYELLYPGGGEDGRPFLMGLTTIEQLKKKISDQQTEKGEHHGHETRHHKKLAEVPPAACETVKERAERLMPQGRWKLGNGDIAIDLAQKFFFGPLKMIGFSQQTLQQ
jgi:hypothetical protein